MAKTKVMLSIDPEIAEMLEQHAIEKHMTKSALVTQLILTLGKPKTLKGQQRLNVKD